jgi:hypothetical protein
VLSNPANIWCSNKVVPKASAVIPGKPHGVLNVDHKHLNKFPSEDDQGYQRVSAVLQHMVKNAETTVPNYPQGPKQHKSTNIRAASQRLLSDLDKSYLNNSPDYDHILSGAMNRISIVHEADALGNVKILKLNLPDELIESQRIGKNSASKSS